MSKRPTYFVRSCGVCGRTLRVPVSLLGELVNCEHCQATFLADDPNRRPRRVIDAASEFGQRVEMLLTAAHNQRNRGYTNLREDASYERSTPSDIPTSEENR